MRGQELDVVEIVAKDATRLNKAGFYVVESKDAPRGDPLSPRRIAAQLESRLFSMPSVSRGCGELVVACGLLLNSGASIIYVFIYISWAKQVKYPWHTR